MSHVSRLATPPAAPRRHRATWWRRLLSDVLFVARRDRKWLLTPLVLLILALAALMVFGSALGPLAPFLYPLF